MEQPQMPMALPPGFPPMPSFPFPMPNPAMAKLARYPKKPKRPPPTEPNQTLYIHNLHDKKSKKMLKEELFRLFAPYGVIREIHVKKALKMRGQAFVVFRDLKAAEMALKELQGHVLFGRPMDVQFARYKSDVTAEAEGTLEDNKKERAERKAQAGGSSEEEEEDEDEDGKGDSDMEADEDDGDEGERPAKKAKKDNKKDAQPAAAALPGGAFPGYPGYTNAFGYAPEEPPNSILFAQNVPQEADEASLGALFQQYPGFKEVRLVRRNNVAFIEFENEALATVAKMALHGYKMTEDGQPMSVTYAKK